MKPTELMHELAERGLVVDRLRDRIAFVGPATPEDISALQLAKTALLRVLPCDDAPPGLAELRTACRLLGILVDDEVLLRQFRDDLTDIIEGNLSLDGVVLAVDTIGLLEDWPRRAGFRYRGPRAS
jgi:hypothetical protein